MVLGGSKQKLVVLVFLNFLGGFDSFWQFLFVLVGCCWFLVVFSCLWWFLVFFVVFADS